MFKRPTTPDAANADAVPSPDETPEEKAERLAGKGRPTPTRKEREAARKRPLVPADRKEAARQYRTKNADARERARAGMAAGEDRYLTARDKGPQRRYVRDYVDARFNIGEYMIPVMLIVLVLSFIPIPQTQLYGIVVLWAFFIIAVIDCIVLSFRVQRKVGEKFGQSHVERGLRWYAAMRALQLRMIRLPKPQVKRGRFPV